MTNKDVDTPYRFVHGPRPAHTHTCSAGHPWECNSPYCSDAQANCPEHGGLEPLAQGYERRGER